MRAPFDQIVYAYHGCDRAVGESVLLGKTELRKSENPYDWLGHGVYFWENAPEKALDWAKKCSENPAFSKGKITEPYVVGAIIQLRNCWNLLDKENHSLIIKAHQYLLGIFKESGAKDMPENKAGYRCLDCAVINAMYKLWKIERGSESPFDVIRAAFIEGTPLYEKSGFYSDTHIQICMRDASCIKGYFRPTGY